MIIGLVGEIGIGKSFVASCFKEFGAAIFDADYLVNRFYKKNKIIINHARKNFPEVVINNKIEKKKLSKYFLLHDENWMQFQSLVYYTIQNELEVFINQKKELNQKFLILDIPLLLETRFYLYCNIIVFIHANKVIQYERLSKRNMDKKKLNLILNIQLSAKEKKQASHFTIDNNLDRKHILFQIKNIISLLKI